MILSTFTRSLPCRLTDAELLEKAQALSQAVQDISAEEGRQVDIKAQMKAALTEIEARKTQLAIVIGRKEKYRDVTCTDIGDAERGRVETIRGDTGEVVSTRPMTDAERQTSLFAKEE